MALDVKKAISEVTPAEFSDFLTSKKISRYCKCCGEAALQINIQKNDNENQFVRVIQSPLLSPEGGFFPTFLRICANCSAVEQYGALSAYESIKRQRNGSVNDKTQ